MDSANNENYKVHFFPHLQRRRKLSPGEVQYSLSATNLEKMLKENHQKISKKGKSNENSHPRKQKTVHPDSNHLPPLPDTHTAHPEDSITRNQIYSESDIAVSLGREPESHPHDLDQFVPDTFYDNYHRQPRGPYPYPQDYIPTSLRVYPEQPMTSTPFPRNSFEMLKRDHYGSGSMYPFQHPQTSSAAKHQSLYRHPRLLEPPVHYYNYTPYEPQRKHHDYEHGYKYQNQDPDPQRRPYQYPQMDGDQIYDYCERGHPYYERGMRGWPYRQRTKGEQDEMNPLVEVQRSQPFTSTLDHMKVEDGLSCITDNFTELELLRGDDLGVIKSQPFQHPNNIPRLDAGHERFWDSPMTMMAPDSGFDPGMDDCHHRYNREMDMPEIPKSRTHCMTNFQYPTKGPIKGTATHTITSKSMENTELKNPHPLDKKMLKTHQKLTDLAQKHCTENRVHNQLRCLDKVAQWISTLDVMPSLSSTTSGIDMEHFDFIESPEVTPDHISAEPKILKRPEQQCHINTLADTNDKMEKDLADDEEQGREPRPQYHHKILTDINDIIETDVSDEPDIQCHDLSPPSTNDKPEAEVADSDGGRRDVEAIPEVNLSQICTIIDSQTDPGIHLESTVQESVKPAEDDVIPQTEKQEELSSESKETKQNEQSTATIVENEETEQNEGTTVTSDVSGFEPRNYPEEIDDAETSIFEELNFLYYQGETTSHTASNDSWCSHQPDTDFILKALTSPWKETGVSLPPPQLASDCETSQQENHPDESAPDDVCSSSKTSTKSALLFPNDSISEKDAVKFQAAEASVGSSQQENLHNDSITALSGDALFQENSLADMNQKEICSSMENAEGSSTEKSEPTMTPSIASDLQGGLQDDLSLKDVGSSTKSNPIDSDHQEECSLTESQNITLKANQEGDLSTIGSDASTLSTLHYSGVTTESLVQATQNADMIDIEAVEASPDKTLTLNAKEHMENENGDVSTTCEPLESKEASSQHSATSSTTFMAESHVEAIETMSASLHPESVKTHIHDSLDVLNTKDIQGKDTSTPDENLQDSERKTSRPELPEMKKSTLRRKRLRKSAATRKPAYSRNRSKLSRSRNQKHQKKDSRHRILLRGKSAYNLRKIENSVHIELETGFNWTAEISESPLKDNIKETINQLDNSGITLAVSPKLMLNISKESLNTERKNDLEANADTKSDAPISSGQQEQLDVNPRNLRSRSRSASTSNVIERSRSSSSSKGMIISVQRKTAEQIKNDSTSIVKCNKTSPKNLRRRNSKAVGPNTPLPFHSVPTSSTSNDLKDKESMALPTCNVKPILKTIERSRVTHKQRSKAKVAVKTTKPKSVAFMTSFNPNEDTLKESRRKKACYAEKGNRPQATKGKESSLKTTSEVKPVSKGISKKISKAEPKKIIQKNARFRNTSRKMQPQVNLNEKNMLGSSKVDMIVPCSLDVKHLKNAESKTKKRKAVVSNNDDNVPKQRKVSKTSNMSQRFVARPWRSPSTSEINAEKSQQTNLREGLRTVADHVHSGKCSKSTAGNHPSSIKSEERNSQRCASRKIEHGSKTNAKQAQFPDSKLVSVKPKKASTIRNRSAPKDNGGISKTRTDRSTSLKKSSKTSDQSASNIQTRRRLQTLYSPSVVLNDGDQMSSTHPEKTRMEPLKNITEVACGASSKVQTHQILASVDSKSDNLNGPSCIEVTNKPDCPYDKDKSEPQKPSLSVNSCQEAPPCSSLQSFVGAQAIDNKSGTLSCPVEQTHPKTMVDVEDVVEARSMAVLEPNHGTVETESTSNKGKVVKRGRGRPPSKTPKKETVVITKKKTKTACHNTDAKGLQDNFTSPDKGSQTSNIQIQQVITENASSGSLSKNDTGNQSVNHSKNLVQERQHDTSSLQVHSTNLETENKKINGDIETTSFEVFQSLKAATDVDRFNKCSSTERASLPSKSVVKQHKLMSFANADRLFHLKKLLGDYSSTFKLKTSTNYSVEKQKLKNILPSRMLSRIPATKLFRKMLPQIQRNLQRNFNLEFKRPPLLEQTHTSRYFNKMLQPNHIPYKFNPMVHKKHQNNVMQTITIPDPQNGVWVSRVPDLFNEPLTEMLVNDSFCYSDMDTLSILSEDLALDDTRTSGLLTDVLFGQSADLDRPEPNDGSIKEKMDDLRLQIDIGEILFSTQLNYDNGLDFESILDIKEDDNLADKDSQLDLIMNSIEMYDAVQDSSILSPNEDKNFRQVTAPLESSGSDKITFTKESTNDVKHSYNASSVQSPCSSGASSPSTYGYNEQNPDIVTSIQQHFQTIIEVDEKPKHQSKETSKSNPSHPDLIGAAWKCETDRPAIGNISVPLEENTHKPNDSSSILNSFRKVGLFLEIDHPCEIDHDVSKDVVKVTENRSDDDSCLYSDDADLPIDGQIIHVQNQMILHNPQNFPSRHICSDINPKAFSDIADTNLFDPFGVKSFVQKYQRVYPAKPEALPHSVPNPPGPEKESEQSASMVITSYEDSSMQGEDSICLEVDPSSPKKCNAKTQTCESSDDLTISSIVEKVRKSKAKRKRNRGKCTSYPTNADFDGATESASKKAKVLKDLDSSSRRRTTKSLSDSVHRANKRRRQTIAAIKDSTSTQIKAGSQEPVSHRRMSATANTSIKRTRSSSSISKSNQEYSSKRSLANTKQKRSKSLGNSSDDIKPVHQSIKTEKASDSRERKRTRSSSPISKIKAAASTTKGTKHKRTKSCGATPADCTIGKGKKSTKFTTRSTRIKCDRSDDIKDDWSSDSSTEPDDSDKRPSLYKVECRFCQEVFVEEDALRIHSKLQHDTEEVWKNVICGYCSKVCGRKYRFHCHLLTEHSNEDWERYPCPICLKDFPASYRLNRHINEHMLHDNEHMSEDNEHMSEDNEHKSEDNEHMSEDNEHKSEDNDRMSEDNEHMSEDNEHMLDDDEDMSQVQDLEHMSQDNVLSYKCLLCSAMLSKSESDLRHHFETNHEEFHENLMKQYHSNEDVKEELEIFVCRYCGVFGLSLQEFKQHVIESHNSFLAQFETDEVKDSFVSEILEMDKLAIFSESCYLCIYCSKKIDSVEEANDHITGNHSQMMQNPLDDQYLCAFCNFCTATPYKMKKHIGKNHWFIESLMANSAIMYFKPEKSE